jgi:hypothetical protein
VRQVVLALIAFAEQAQVLFGASEVIIGAAADPIIIRVRGNAVAHNPGDYFKRFGE